MKSIFLAEKENHVRAALRLLIEYQPGMKVAGEADHTESLLAQVCRHPPDVILVDWNLVEHHPQRLICALQDCCPETQIVAISVKPEEEKTAFDYQVDGFLLKQLTPELFIAGLNAIISNKSASG